MIPINSVLYPLLHMLYMLNDVAISWLCDTVFKSKRSKRFNCPWIKMTSIFVIVATYKITLLTNRSHSLL